MSDSDNEEDHKKVAPTEDLGEEHDAKVAEEDLKKMDGDLRAEILASKKAIANVKVDKSVVLKLPPNFKEDAEYFPVYDTSKGNGTSVSNRDEAPIRYAKKGTASQALAPALTIPQMLLEAVSTKGDKPALGQEVLAPLGKDDKPPASKDLAEWRILTWKQYYDQVQAAGKAFIKLGLKRFDAVSIFGFNSPEWIIAEIAAIQAGGIAAGIYPTDTPDQVYFKARHSGAVIAAVEGIKQAKAFLGRAKELPDLKAVVVWGEDVKETEENGVKLLSWARLLEIGTAEDDAQIKSRIASLKPGNVCCLIYTSGTTGNPKAVMITHDNILWESQCVAQMVPALGGGTGQERIISYLPLSHVAGMMLDVVCPIILTALKPSYTTVYFARNYDLKIGTLGDRLRAIRPTVFLGVPRVWEKIAETMKAMVAKNPPAGLKKTLITWAKKTGLQHQVNCQLGGSGKKGWGYGIAKGKVLDLVRQRLGLDACKFAFTGAAPISTETLSYYGSLGIQINEVYGMSECTGATTWSTDQAHVWGSCGWNMYGAEVKIFGEDGKEVPRCDDLSKVEEKFQGEICFRGRHIMLGYMANPTLGAEHVEEMKKKTAEAINAAGWLRSGDKGCIDKRGMVKITGRYKELIISAGGENIAPVPIEDFIKKCHPGISNVMMVGDKRKFNVCLVTLKAKGATGVTPGTDELDGAALKVKEGVTTISAASKDADWIKSITKAITDANNDGNVCPSNASKIQKFTILPRDFSSDTEEFTPTYKLKRAFVEKKYAKAIDKIYEGKDDYVPFDNA